MKKKSQTVLFGLLIVSFLLVWIAHIAYPLEADDFFYITNLVTGAPLSSLSDIWESQVWHYFNWGGRSIGHTILQLTLMFGQPVTNILNVCVTVLLLYLLCKVADVKGIELFFAAFSMLFGTVVAWKSCMFWQSGSANYLYMSCIVFFYLLIYLRTLRDQKDFPFVTLWILPLGLMAGWSNENVGPTLWVLSAIILYLNYKSRKKVPAWMLLGNISCLAGSIILICAPGNFVRSAFSPDNEMSLPKLILSRILNECTGLFYAMIYAVLFSAFLFVIGKCILKIALGRDRILYLFGSLLSWGALILSPAFTDRAFFGPTLFLILFCLSYIKDILSEREDLYLPMLGLTSVFWLRGMYFVCEHIVTHIGTII